MIINFNFNASVLALTSNEYNGKTYHNAVLFIQDSQNSEAGTFKVPEDVANHVRPGESYTFHMCYNDKFQSPYIKGVSDIE